MDKEKFTRKNLPRVVLVLGNLALASSAILSGCGNEENADLGNQTETAISPTFEKNTPINNVYFWRQDQLAVNEYNIKSGPIQEVEYFQSPPFYEGQDTLKFDRHLLPSSGTSSVEIVLADEFDGFTNFYIYENIILVGIQTYDEEHLLAEAKLFYLPPNRAINPDQIIMDEIHYDSSGNITFTAKSEVNFNRGWKATELVTTGNKAKEYYFLLPIQ